MEDVVPGKKSKVGRTNYKTAEDRGGQTGHLDNARFIQASLCKMRRTFQGLVKTFLLFSRTEKL